MRLGDEGTAMRSHQKQETKTLARPGVRANQNFPATAFEHEVIRA